MLFQLVKKKVNFFLSLGLIKVKPRKLKFIILLLFSIPLFSTTIIYTTIKEEIYRNNTFQYQIKAQKKVENFKKDTKTLFFNRKKYVSNNFYYEKGSVKNKKYHISFNHLFIYGQNLYIKKAKGKFANYTFKAKSIIIYKHKIIFNHIFFKSKKKKGSKLKFIYYFSKKEAL